MEKFDKLFVKRTTLSFFNKEKIMGDKNDKNKNKNKHKLTSKEKKAQNHLKLMEGFKDKSAIGNTVAQNQNSKDKKAA